MHVLEVISGLGRGGAEIALAQRLNVAPASVTTHVISTRSVQQGIDFSSNDVVSLSLPARNELTTRQVESIAVEVAPDVIITHNPREALRALRSKRLRDLAPIVVVAHNRITSEYPLKALALNSLLPQVNAHSALHIAVSTDAARGYQCRGSQSTEVCLLGSSVAPTNGSDVEIWPSDTSVKLLGMSRFSPQKNLGTLLAAIAELASAMRDCRAHLALIGEGELSNQLERERLALGIADLVTMLPWTPEPQLPLAHADALLISSRHEGGPLTLYEALLSGTRVCSTPCGAAPDVLGSHPGEIVLDGHSIAELAAGVETLLAMPGNSEHERTDRASRFAHLDVTSTAANFYRLVEMVAA